MRKVQQMRNQIARGRPVFGTFLVELRSPGVAASIAMHGFDFFMVDAEHGLFDVTELRHLIDAGHHRGICPLVRVPWTNPSLTAQVLDAGVEGIVFPQVRTMEQVQRIVQITKYPPLGQRGLHFLVGHSDFKKPDSMSQYMEQANRELLTLVQIETREAAGLVEDIAGTEGVDALYVGPGDLAANLGHADDRTRPEMDQVMRKVGEACRRHGKLAGTHFSDPSELGPLIEWGFSIFGYECGEKETKSRHISKAYPKFSGQ